MFSYNFLYYKRGKTMKRIISISLFATASLLFTACTSSEILAPESPSFKLGVQDGCATATGTYTKSSDSFNNDTDYAEGWFSGRKKCNPVQSRT